MNMLSFFIWLLEEKWRENLLTIMVMCEMNIFESKWRELLEELIVNHKKHVKDETPIRENIGVHEKIDKTTRIKMFYLCMYSNHFFNFTIIFIIIFSIINDFIQQFFPYFLKKINIHQNFLHNNPFDLTIFSNSPISFLRILCFPASSVYW